MVPKTANPLCHSQPACPPEGAATSTSTPKYGKTLGQQASARDDDDTRPSLAQILGTSVPESLTDEIAKAIEKKLGVKPDRNQLAMVLEVAVSKSVARNPAEEEEQVSVRVCALYTMCSFATSCMT